MASGGWVLLARTRRTESGARLACRVAAAMRPRTSWSRSAISRVFSIGPYCNASAGQRCHYLAYRQSHYVVTRALDLRNEGCTDALNPVGASLVMRLASRDIVID